MLPIYNRNYLKRTVIIKQNRIKSNQKTKRFGKDVSFHWTTTCLRKNCASVILWITP